MPNSMNPDELATFVKVAGRLDELGLSFRNKIDSGTFAEPVAVDPAWRDRVIFTKRPDWATTFPPKDIFTPVNPPINPPISSNTTTDANSGTVIAPAPMPQIRVRPGDIIDSDLFNLMLQRLESLEQRPTNGFMQLGSLGVNTRTLVALGTGFENTGGIFLDGTPVLQGLPTRGINLVVFNPQLLRKFQRSYDTLVDQNASAQLVTDLETQATPGDVVAVVTHDAYQGTPFTTAARQALSAVGGETLAKGLGTGRDNGCFIGVVPTNRTLISFDYLVSVMAADGQGFNSTLLVAQPFVWGVYNTNLKRFVIGGGSGSQGALRKPEVVGPVGPIGRFDPIGSIVSPVNPTKFIDPGFIVAPAGDQPISAVVAHPTDKVVNPGILGAAVIEQPAIAAVKPTAIAGMIATPNADLLAGINLATTLVQPGGRGLEPSSATFEADMPVTKLPGLGRSENTALGKIDIANLGALAAADPAKVARALKVELTEAEQLTVLARTMLG
jgi:Interleukin-like EMT inducer